MPDRPPPVDLLEFVGEAGRQFVLPEPAPADERRRHRSERHHASAPRRRDRRHHDAEAPVPPAVELPTELYLVPQTDVLAEHHDLEDDEYEYVYVDTGEVVPDGLHHLTGDPELHYVSSVGSTTSHGRQRAWLACVLVLALVLPALVVTLGYNRDTGTAEAASAPSTTEATVAESSTSAEIATTESTRKRATTTTEEPTTTSSTEAPTTSTTWGTTSTSAAPATTSSIAYAPVAAAAPAPPPTTAAPTTTVYVAPTTVAPLGEAAFLACVRQRESGGNYGAVSPDGLYRGAYQFHQATWDNVARMAGRHDLVGVPPNLASPADQDLLAVTLYRVAGPAPWGGYCT